MAVLRTLTIMTATLLAVVGCSAPGKFKKNNCVACQSGIGTPYYHDATPVPPAPTPLLEPPPVPEGVPDPSTVPQPPGTAAQPTRIQQMRAATTTFFMNAGHQIRAVFTR
jgi:hypothetical protein